MPSDSKERRRHPRAALKIPVDYRVVDAFLTEFSANVNEGGMFVEMKTPVEIDTRVQLQFRLPGLDKPVHVGGRVAWTSDGRSGAPSGVGIEFQNLSKEARKTINQIVRQLRRPRS